MDALTLTTFLSGLLPVIITVVLAVASLALTARIIRLYRDIKEVYVTLQIIPRAGEDDYRKITKLFSALHGLRESRSIVDKILGREVKITFEIHSQKAQGIRYLVRVPAHLAENMKSAIRTFLPEGAIEELDELPHFSPTSKAVRLASVRQTGHYAYPLNRQADSGHDPMAYLTQNMTNLNTDERMATQIIIKPIKSRKAESLARRIMYHEEYLHHLGSSGTGIVSLLLDHVSSFLFILLDAVGTMFHGSAEQQRNIHPLAKPVGDTEQKRPARVLSSFESELAAQVYTKLNQPLFDVDINILLEMDDDKRLHERLRGVRDWLALFKMSKYQSLRLRRHVPGVHAARLWIAQKGYLLSPLRRPMLFGVDELADIYHFTGANINQTQNTVQTRSKMLSAPVSMKGSTPFDVVLGVNRYHGVETPIGLTAKDRERHMFIIGGTGNGKTTLLQYAIAQDIKNGKGVAVIDPHGDMAEMLLGHIPKKRIDDVIYFNPDDLAHPIGLNLLELTPRLEGDDLLREKDLVTESVVSTFRKIFSEDDSGGHRIEYVLRNAVQTALTVEDATLFTVYSLLNDPRYRKKIVAKLDDDNLVNFWKNELGKAGGFQQVKMVAGITSKIGRFLFSASAKRILEQPKSTVNFDEILNGKILICNFSKGLLGEDTSELFGIAVLAKLQLASLRRARIKQADRRPFYLYVDEFQNFATPSFVQMLSESRKYKLYLTMAEQSTSQQADQKMINIILANVGTVITFRSGNPADERLMLPLFKPHIDENEIANLPAYNFYMRIATQKSQEPLSGLTLLLDGVGSSEIAKRTIEASRKYYATKYLERNSDARAVERSSAPKIKASGFPDVDM